jgi:hypothetical protein
MTCKHIKRAIKSLICGEQADIESIQQHLSECSRCADKYARVLILINAAKPAPVPLPDADTWKQLSAQLHRRIRQEHPAPLGWWQSRLLRIGEWKLIRFRKALSASVAAFALVLAVTVFLNQQVPESPRPEVAKKSPTPTDTTVPRLPPDMEDIISILGRDGFITGVDEGWLRLGDFFAGHELRPDSVIETLDYFYGTS